ncbi:MAG: hypothetical protein II177_02190 [Lachnospiraceae bacterium]|nr:hypothetical protein [Lachnospiraceae bacterium]
METRGLFKRIAAITMAALTIVTSSGVDVNLLTANANELTKQATENAVDENTNKALQKKDAKVGAQAKLSFSTNEALKRAVDDAGFNIDVKTNKVTSAAIKYNQSLLRLGEDFTATAKRTDCKQNSSKYNYVYTVTVTGKGDYTGSTTRTGVTQVSDIKPATAKKSAATNKKTSTKKNSPKKATPQSDGTYDAGDVNESGTVSEGDGSGWNISFGKNHLVKEQGSNNSRLTYIYSGKEIKPSISVTYNQESKEYGTDYDIDYENNGQKNTVLGTNTGRVRVYAINTFKDDLTTKGAKTEITCCFDIVSSVTILDKGTICLLDETATNTEANRSKHKVEFRDGVGYADGTFEFTGSVIKPQVAVNVGTNKATGKDTYQIIQTNNATGQKVEYEDDGNATSKVGTFTSVLNLTLGSTYANEKVRIKYTVVARSIKSNSIKVGDINDVTYNGKAQTPEIKVTDTESNKKLVESPDNGKTGDYTVSYSNNTNVGTASVTIQGCNNYTGTITKNFNIKPKNVDDTSKVKINVSPATYDGTKKEPEVTITDTEINTGEKDENQNDIPKTLTRSTDYTLNYYNNDKLGDEEKTLTAEEAAKYEKPYIKVVYQGNYTGTVYKAFKIRQRFWNIHADVDYQVAVAASVTLYGRESLAAQT